MVHLGQWLLIALFLTPPSGAVTLAFVRPPRAIWWVGFSFFLLASVLAISLLIPLSADFKLMRIHFRADRLTQPFLVLTTALFPVLFVVSAKARQRISRFVGQLLLVEFSSIGVFVSFNALQLALFLAAVVASLRTLATSDQGHAKPTLAFPVYLSLGMLCILTSIFATGPVGGTFDLTALTIEPRSLSPLLFIGCVAGCCFWLAIVPLHGWLDQLLATASAPVTILAPVLAPAIGGYSLFRLVGPLFPQPLQSLSVPLSMFAIAAILYGGLCALAQHDPKRFIAYSTSLISGFALLAFAMHSPIATTGAVILLLGQGIVITLLLYSSEIPDHSSIALAVLAGIGWLVAPILLGQFLVLLGVFQAARSAPSAFALAIIASLGLLLSGAGAARICYRVLIPAAGRDPVS